MLFRQTLVQRESDEQAVNDHLTGLANRTRFRATSHRALARGARTGRHSAVLVIDMNGFKEVNDTVGHGKLIAMAASIGVAVSAPGELTHDEIVHRADVAMYQAKKLAPRTRWAAWQESFEQLARADHLPAAA